MVDGNTSTAKRSLPKLKLGFPVNAFAFISLVLVVLLGFARATAPLSPNCNVYGDIIGLELGVMTEYEVTAAFDYKPGKFSQIWVCTYNDIPVLFFHQKD